MWAARLHSGHVKIALVAGFAFVPFVALSYFNAYIASGYRELKELAAERLLGLANAAGAKPRPPPLPTTSAASEAFRDQAPRYASSKAVEMR